MKNEKIIPYSRFKEVNNKLINTTYELRDLKEKKYDLSMTAGQHGYLSTLVFNELEDIKSKDIPIPTKDVIINVILNPLMDRFNSIFKDIENEEFTVFTSPNNLLKFKNVEEKVDDTYLDELVELLIPRLINIIQLESVKI